MKRILLLGGFGFIGTNLLKYIDTHFANEFSVIVFDKLPIHPYNIKFECVEKVYAGDFSDNMFLQEIFKQHRFDLVIHSLSTTVPISSNNVRFDIESNLIPTVEVLDLLVKYNVQDIVFISSGGAVYGNSKSNQEYKETDNNYPLSSYGVVKLAIEKYLFQFAALYDIRPLVLRLSNPYGRYHYSNKQGICNVALRSALKGNPLSVWGNGEASKDFIFIDDFCEILFLLYNKSISKRVLNVGSGCVLSLNQIFNEIKTLIPSFTLEYSEAPKYDVSHFRLDTNELLNIIGEYNFTSFKEGINLSLEWMKESNK